MCSVQPVDSAGGVRVEEVGVPLADPCEAGADVVDGDMKPPDPPSPPAVDDAAGATNCASEAEASRRAEATWNLILKILVVVRQ